MAAPRLGFVGFGEAASRIAAGLRELGKDDCVAYDIAREDGVAGERIRRRASETRVELVASNAELMERCSIVFSLVTASSALDAAKQNRPHLAASHLYVDGNSVSPARKCEIAEVIESAGGRFVEAAILAPVPKHHGQRVPMLVNGAHAEELGHALGPLGFEMETLCGPFGTAAAVKVCRSIVVKGMEALLTECVLAASQFGADERVFASLQRSHPGIQWKELANYMVNRVTVHGARRAHEMEEVAETLRAVGIDPIMAEATARRQNWAAELALASRFGPEGPKTYAEVIAALSDVEKVTPER
ncbi:MAG TPA: DUF1932 domain-containing protein [Bryobacteraceae bacterium]|nr:DUF1932 domain-containing protein [Bryobacteraceae bacterium]